VRRRDVIRLSGRVLVGGSAWLAAACSLVPRAASPTVAPTAAATVSSARGGQLPAYIPLQPVKPDLPSEVEGQEAAYLSYPRDAVPSVQQPPGKGGDVEILVWNPGPPLSDQNLLWKELNKQVGANLKFNAVAVPDYPTKLNTVLASGTLPDTIFISNGTSVDRLPEFVQAQCANLTPYLGGEAVKDYPNLASLPTRSWRAGVFNNALYGIPIASPPFSAALWVHQQLMDGIGAGQPHTADEFKDILRRLTRPQEGVWGLIAESGSAYGVTNGLYTSIFRVPNNWRLEPSGSLTRNYEVEEFKASVSYAREIFAAGYYSPNVLTSTNASGRAEFAGRKVAMRYDGFGGAGAVQYLNAAATLSPPSVLRRIRPFAYDGGRPSFYLANGNFGYHLLKKASPERIREILGIFNFFAAPFGTREYLLTRYGLPNTHHTLDAAGNPVLTDQGKADVSPVFPYVASPTSVLYYPQSADFTRAAHADERAWIDAGVDDPTLGLYSPTAASRGPVLDRTLTEGVAEIVNGRMPLSELDGLVAAWKSGGGDQIRREFEQALQAAR
jgi:putative aldouronate transport system substrate-binding protein